MGYGLSMPINTSCQIIRNNLITFNQGMSHLSRSACRLNCPKVFFLPYFGQFHARASDHSKTPEQATLGRNKIRGTIETHAPRLCQPPHDGSYPSKSPFWASTMWPTKI